MSRVRTSLCTCAHTDARRLRSPLPAAALATSQSPLLTRLLSANEIRSLQGIALSTERECAQ